MELSDVLEEKEIDILILSYIKAYNAINKSGVTEEEVLNFVDWAIKARMYSFILRGVLEGKLFALYNKEEDDYCLYTKEQLQKEIEK